MGQMLVDLLKQLRDTKGFSELKTAARCELGVEADDGTFGWPRYEDRGKANLV